MGKYILNQETQKIELHFSKPEYMALSDSQKQEIKCTFLFSGKAGAWVSRSTNNHWRAEQVAKKLNLEDGGKIGERLSYAEQLEVKAEKAEARAERYETYSDNAEKRAVQLQAALNSHRGDIAFFTQPIIAGHAGSQAFANYRERLYNRYHKGFEEYKKSEYYQDRAATARGTASNAKLQDRVYLCKKIKEQNKEVKTYQDIVIKYEEALYKIQQGEELKNRSGEILTEAYIEQRISEMLEKYEWEHDKFEFFEKCLADLGGIQFSKDNIKIGFIVKIRHSNKCEILSAGPVNVTYKILEGGAAGMVLTCPYAEIGEIIQTKEKTDKVINPFTAGDILCTHYGMDTSNAVYKAFQVVKTTETGVKIQQIAVDKGVPVPGKFIGEPLQKKVAKSKFRDFVGVYDGNWQLHKYEVKEMAGAV